MLAYRFENDRRGGPFTDLGISWMDPTRYNTLPAPYEEGLDRDDTDLCAAPSPHMLRRWFPKRIRQHLIKHGFCAVVIETPWRPRKLGRHQILVDRYDPIVGTLCPLTLTLH